MSIWIISSISLFLSLLIGFIVNSISNNGLGFLKGDSPFFSRYIVFRVITPLFLTIFGSITLILGIHDLVSRSVQLLALCYLFLILSWYNKDFVKRKKLKKFIADIKSDIMIPWFKSSNYYPQDYNVNCYYVGKSIRGEVVIFSNDETDSRYQDEIRKLRNELSKIKISLHVRKSKLGSMEKYKSS